MCRSRTCTWEIYCACVPAKRCRWTASSWRARARSTNRCSPASPPGHQARRRQGHRRHAEHHGQPHDALGARRRRDHALADRSDGGAGAALEGADAADGGSRRRLLRRDGRADRRRDILRVGTARRGAGLAVRAHQRRIRADHRVSLRARPCNADVDHGGDGKSGDAGHSVSRCVGHREFPAARHDDRRQDRHADRRQAGLRFGRRRRGNRRTRGAAPGREPRSGQRAPAGGRHRAKRRASKVSCLRKPEDFDSSSGIGVRGVVDGPAAGAGQHGADAAARRGCGRAHRSRRGAAPARQQRHVPGARQTTARACWRFPIRSRPARRKRLRACTLPACAS